MKSMKKITLAIILISIICIAFNNPNDSPKSDYRDTYTGSYLCNRVCSKGFSPELSSSTDTISIDITKDKNDSLLKINLGQQVLTVKLINNILQAYPKSGHYGGKFFAKDSLDLYFAAGRALSCRYLGKKRS